MAQFGGAGVSYKKGGCSTGHTCDVLSMYACLATLLVSLEALHGEIGKMENTFLSAGTVLHACILV